MIKAVVYAAATFYRIVREISEECVKKWLRFDRWIKKKNESYDTGSRCVLPVSHKVEVLKETVIENN